MAGQGGWDPSTPYVAGQGFRAATPGAAGSPVPPPPAPPGRGRARGPLVGIAVVAGIVLLALVVWAAIRAPGPSVQPLTGSTPGTVQAAKRCPTYPRPSGAAAQAADGRVHGGRLSYPLLGAPWSAPAPIWRTPYTVDATWQWIETEADVAGAPTWVSGVEVSELSSGDGMPHPADAHEMVLDCVMGTYETAVQRTYVASRAAKVSGYEAWYVEAHLTFDTPGIEAKGEVVLLMLVRTGESATSMFYASIPDGNPSHLADARKALEGLRVG